MTRLVAVIDLGKTNTKLALVDTAQAKEVELTTQANQVKTDDRYPYIDHHLIESFLVDSLHNYNQQYDIDALTVTTHGATAALIDNHGQLTLPVMDYEFNGVEELTSSYDLIRPKFSETGSPRLPVGLNLGAQFYWQQQHYPREFSRTHTILTWPQYWVYRLCGALHNDLSSLGCHTDLYAPSKRCYSSLVTERGWDTLLPATHNSGEFCGDLDPIWQKRINRSTRLPVYTGIHDSNASLVPYLINETAPFSVVSTGTWFISMAVGGSEVSLDEKRDTLWNVNALGDPVPSARFMGGRERDLLSTNEQATGTDWQQLINDSRLYNGMLLPSTVAGTGPFPDRQAYWVNQPDDTTIRHGMISLYLGLMSAQCLSLIGAKGSIFVEGPMGKDPIFANMLSLATGQQVFLNKNETGTSVGAAMLISAPVNKPGYQSASIVDSARDPLVQYADNWRTRVAETPTTEPC